MEEAEGPAPQGTAMAKSDRHDKAMRDYKAMDLQIAENGTVKLSTAGQRKLFAYGYFFDGCAPGHFTSWKQVEEGIELLQGMGAPALSNLHYLYFVREKLTAMHKLCLGACEGTGEVEHYKATWVDKNNEPLSEKNVVNFTAEACIVRVRRKGRDGDAIGYYTMKEAADNDLIEKKGGMWKKNAKDMLYHRASMRALTQHFSDVLQGVRCKEIEDLMPMLGPDGQPLRAVDGRQIYQSKLLQAQEAFEKLKEKQ